MDKAISIKDLRKFGIMLGVVLSVPGGINLMKGHSGIYPWFFGAAIAAILLAVLVPKALRPVHVVFSKIARAVGWFNTRVLLIVVYYLMMTPIGIIMKVFRKDPLNRKQNRQAASYWEKRPDVTAAKESLERQF